jgi:16S rRNA (guanine(966)-N(2))-methyltransferase RsmD
MRVIAGTYRSRPLTAPAGRATRPTSDRLRETLFNVLAGQVEGTSFADLFAGSGAVGIEALSRGARYVCFAEDARGAIAAIRSNLASLKIEDGFSIETRGAAAALRPEAGTAAGRPWDLVFLDPPYQDGAVRDQVLTVLGRQAKSLLAPGALVVAEHQSFTGRPAAGSGPPTGDLGKPPAEAPAERYGALIRYRVLRQGDAALSFYRLEERE